MTASLDLAALARLVSESHPADAKWACSDCCDTARRMTALAASVPALLAEVAALRGENGNLREFIAASKECAQATDVLAVYSENERIRGLMSKWITDVTKDGHILFGTCSWCEEKWLHAKEMTVEEMRGLPRTHAFRCKSHPMRIERDAACAERDAAKSELAEASRIWADDVRSSALAAKARRDGMMVVEKGGWTRTIVELDEARSALDAARADADRMRPVVEAARAWVTADGSIGKIIDALDVLDANAIDALDAGTEVTP